MLAGFDGDSGIVRLNAIDWHARQESYSATKNLATIELLQKNEAAWQCMRYTVGRHEREEHKGLEFCQDRVLNCWLLRFYGSIQSSVQAVLFVCVTTFYLIWWWSI